MTRGRPHGLHIRSLIVPMTVDVLHSDSEPQLGLEQESLTGQAQRNVRA